MTQEDPLADLLLDAREVDRARLADALRNLLGIDGQTGRIVFKRSWNDLTARQKIVAYLLGRKSAILLDKLEDLEVGPKEIADDTSLASGTVAPTVRQLLSERVVTHKEGGAYYVADSQVLAAIGELEKKAGL